MRSREEKRPNPLRVVVYPLGICVYGGYGIALLWSLGAGLDPLVIAAAILGYRAGVKS